MSSLKKIEFDVLQAIRDVIYTYKNYEDNFNDEKYDEIETYFIQPLVSKSNSLLVVFEEIENTINNFLNDGIIDESEV